MSNLSVTFDKICLIDAILPATVHDISEIQLITNELEGVQCYVKDVLAEPYPEPLMCRRFDIPQELTEDQVKIGNKYTSNKSLNGTDLVTYTVIEILRNQQVESTTGFVNGTILICSGNKTTGAYNDSVLTLVSGTGDATLNCSYQAVGLSSDYPTGKPDIGHYIQLDNYGFVDGEILKRAMDCDKITFLLISDSTFDLKNVEIKFKGDITKTRNAPKYSNTLPISYFNEQTNLLTYATFDSTNISHWLKNNLSACGLIPHKPVDNILPNGISEIITLNSTDGSIIQGFTPIISTTEAHNSNYKVKVWARYFPDIFDETTQEYPKDASITENSFDWAKLNIQLYDTQKSVQNNATVKMTKLVGLHWTEIEVDIVIPPVAGKTWYLGLSVEDKPIQLAKCMIV